MVNTESQFIARQPILDRKEQVFAYEVLYRNSKENIYPKEIDETQATFSVNLDAILLHGAKKVSDDNLIFINLCTRTLLEKLPQLLNPNNVVIEITERTEDLDNVCLMVQELKQRNYKFALDDYDGHKKWDSLLHEVEYIKLEAVSPIIFTLLRIKKLKRKYPNKKIIVERIEDKHSYENLKRVGCDYFQGYFFSKPKMTQLTNITSSKLIVLELIRLANNKKFSFELIAKSLEKDVGLSIRLLRFLNNIHTDTQNKFRSIYQTIVYLGEDKLRHFIKILCVSELGAEKSSHLVVKSLSRAYFISRLMEGKGTTLKEMGYFLGLISLLDIILNVNFKVIVEELNLPEYYLSVLYDYHGGIGSLILLCKKIEEDDWQSVATIVSLLGLELCKVKEQYQNALDYADISLDMEQQNIIQKDMVQKPVLIGMSA